jgi:hypothetical protein
MVLVSEVSVLGDETVVSVSETRLEKREEVIEKLLGQKVVAVL